RRSRGRLLRDRRRPRPELTRAAAAAGAGLEHGLAARLAATRRRRARRTAATDRPTAPLRRVPRRGRNPYALGPRTAFPAARVPQRERLGPRQLRDLARPGSARIPRRSPR